MKHLLVIGMGHAGTRHARIARQLGHEVTWIDPGKSHTEAAAWQRDGLYRESLLLRAVRQADAAIVATPPEAHFAAAAVCLAHGVPTLVEKPLCATLERAHSLCHLATESGTLLACGYQLRAHAELMRRLRSVREVRGFLSIQYRSPAWPPASYARDYLLECSHEFDLAGMACSGVHAGDLQRFELPAPRAHTRFLAHLYGPMQIVTIDVAAASPQYERTVTWQPVGTDQDEPWRWEFSHERNERAYEEQMRAFLDGAPYCTGQQALDALRLTELVSR